MDYEAAVATFFTAPPEGTTAPDVVNRAGPSRQLRDALEPLAMHAVWSHGVNAALAERGLDFLSAYVYGRASCLGDVPSSVVTSTFAVFPYELIDEQWTTGQGKIDRTELIELRDEATAASLRKILGDVTTEREIVWVAGSLERAVDKADGAGRPLFSALRSAPRLTDPYGRLWRAAEMVREHRGDGHVAASVAAGLGPCEMNIVTELWLGYPMGEYSNTRGWSREATESAIARLTVAGFIANWELTDDGRDFRDTIEKRTDATQRSLIDALGGRLGPVLDRVSAWSKRCIAAGAFPSDPRKRAAG
ncbi:SCO6745 family protein [Pseudonocardia spinosispora]|uniref:SCO6745 family protein n=1 Tax=Pseudonocardia spinosispora TaxID=103441 RepID=UPI000418FE71|nr:hypothetical protein [Pseudonocardia spinosispora]